jgi:DNA-binding MarR family transcriptional regulator
MEKAAIKEAEVILDRFIEMMFKLIMDHHQKQILELELTLPQAQALRVLRRAPLCTRDLAAALGISAPAVTQLTDRMIRKDLLERRAVKGDRRSVHIALSERGRQTIDRFRKRRNSIFSGALSDMGEQDRAEVVTALDKIVTALEEYVSDSIEVVSGNQENEQENGLKTAVRSQESSNSISRPTRVPASARMKLEWD